MEGRITALLLYVLHARVQGFAEPLQQAKNSFVLLYKPCVHLASYLGSSQFFNDTLGSMVKFITCMSLRVEGTWRSVQIHVHFYWEERNRKTAGSSYIVT